MSTGVQLVGVVGNQSPVSDGSEVPFRQAKDKAVVTSPAHGDYYETTSRGFTFSGLTAVAGTTVVAANVSPIAAAAATVISLYNPLGSGSNLEVLKAWLNFISGTPGAGAWIYNMAYNQAITATPNNGNTAGAIPQPNYISGKTGIGRIYTQTALTGGIGAQNLLRPFGATAFAAAIAASSPTLNFIDECCGDIVIPPGGLLSIAAPALGTTTIVAAGFEWQEIEIQS